MLFRSVLFVPGARSDRFAKALAAGADVVIFDLEDAVAVERKLEARRAVADFLANRPTARSRLFVRVNATGSAWIDGDVEAAAALDAISGVVLPKVETARQIEDVARRIPSATVVPLLETARGILQAASIAAADAKVPALLFGAEDLTADLGIPRTVEGEELLFARSQLVMAAASTSAEPVDAVFTDLDDLDRLRVDAARARALGFRGKMAIHPAQVPVINDVFAPSAEEIARAKSIVEAFEAAKGDAVIRLDHQMIEAPIVLRARRVLTLAREIGRRGRVE
ncbi:MAG TPA: CoA ester lyase [Vicinamibacterales bacterium]|nr:CoA ester lyase [Vicinamibacterales bacterium]